MKAIKQKAKRKVSKVAKLISDFESRIDKGVAYLNRTNPKWYENIELNNLDLKSPFSCVLGQVFDDFWEKVNREGYIAQKGKMSVDLATERAFVLPTAKDGEYELLTRLWWLRIISLRSNLNLD
jgi:hypothetical protein